jgi:hypothetical protein
MNNLDSMLKRNNDFAAQLNWRFQPFSLSMVKGSWMT